MNDYTKLLKIILKEMKNSKIKWWHILLLIVFYKLDLIITSIAPNGLI